MTDLENKSIFQTFDMSASSEYNHAEDEEWKIFYPIWNISNKSFFVLNFDRFLINSWWN